MGVEAFHAGEGLDGGHGLAQGALAVFHHAGAPLELVHGQAGKRPARATRR